MKKQELENCHDCGVKPGELHYYGCDVERCPSCGGQMISCECVYEINGIDTFDLEEQYPEVYENGPSEEMYAKWDAEWGNRRLPWTGEWPGKAECREFGWWCKWVEGQGWKACDADDPDAREDLNRLPYAKWDAELGRSVLYEYQKGK